MTPNLLLVGAFEPEIAPFYEHLPADVLARAVGIGLVDAALGTARVLDETSAKAIVFVGTAGAFPGSGLGLLEVVTLAEAFLADAAVARGLASLLPPMSGRLTDDEALTRALVPLGELRRVTVATTLAITTDDEAAASLEATTGAAVEHLEAYSVARAAAARGIPFACVLGVANMVGSRGREEWLRHHQAAAVAVRDALLRGLQAGAFRPLLRGPSLTSL